MQLMIDKKFLVTPLDECVKFAKNKVIPILNHVLLKAVDKEGLTLIGSNGEYSLEAFIPVDAVEISSPGIIALPASKLSEMVKTLHGKISIQVDGLKATIQSGRKKLELSGLDGEEYPIMNASGGSKMLIEGKRLKMVLDSASYATAKKDDTPILKGIFFKMHNREIQIRASDRNRVAVVNQEFESNADTQAVVSSNSWSKLRGLIGDEEVVTLTLGTSLLKAVTSNYTFTSRVMEGTYPVPDHLISRLEETASFHVNTHELTAAFESAQIIASDNSNIIKLAVLNQNEISVSCEYDGNNFEEVLAISEFKGTMFAISFNNSYALEAIGSISSRDMEFSFQEYANTRGLIFRDLEMQDNFHLIMAYKTK